MVGPLEWRTHLYVGENLSQTFAHVRTAMVDLLTRLEESGLRRFHIFSDGASHFKCNEMLTFLHSTHFFIQWNFYATGHGKSLCDIEGYTSKRAVTNFLRGTPQYEVGTRGITDGKSMWWRRGLDHTREWSILGVKGSAADSQGPRSVG